MTSPTKPVADASTNVYNGRPTQPKEEAIAYSQSHSRFVVGSNWCHAVVRHGGGLFAGRTVGP